MDTSKEYIKMCEKAEEIQKLWWTGSLFGNDGDGLKASGNNGDYFLDNAYGISIKGIGSGTYCREPKPIWLPKQDQLQEMIEGDWITIQVSFYDFIFTYANNLCAKHFNEGITSIHDFVDGNTFYERCKKIVYKKWNSFEKAWLAFVMKEKYNKIWNGEEWLAFVMKEKYNKIWDGEEREENNG